MSTLYKWFNPYDVLPKEAFIGNILDVGAADLAAQLHSKHKELIEEGIASGRYIPVDLPDDIRTWESDMRFDNILCLQMIAYIPLRHWALLFRRLIAMLNTGGHIYVMEAYNKSREESLNRYHHTFNITPDSFDRYLPNAYATVRQAQKRFSRRFGWKSLRGVRRKLFLFGSKVVFVIWEKEGV